MGLLSLCRLGRFLVFLIKPGVPFLSLLSLISGLSQQLMRLGETGEGCAQGFVVIFVYYVIVNPKRCLCTRFRHSTRNVCVK